MKVRKAERKGSGGKGAEKEGKVWEEGIKEGIEIPREGGMRVHRMTLWPGRRTHQERAEEDEGDKVDVGQVGAAALVLILP